MKHQCIIFCLSIATVISFTNCNTTSGNRKDLKNITLLKIDNQNLKTGIAETDYYFGIGSRFEAVSMTDLQNARTIYSFNSALENQRIKKVNTTEIIVIKNNRRTDRREYGNSEMLTKAQKELFMSLGCGGHFSVKTLFLENTIRALGNEEKKYNPHYTIVPETEATYIEGETAFLTYLKENTKKELAEIKDKNLNAIKVYFTVTKNGTIKNVKTEELTTGYPNLDNKFKVLISKTPGLWHPAKNAKGANVQQELTFTFGSKDGC